MRSTRTAPVPVRVRLADRKTLAADRQGPDRRSAAKVAYGERVELAPITRANWRDAAAIQVGAGQLRFIASYEPVALVILSKAFVRVGDVDWWPYVVQDLGQCVGVLALVDERERNGQVALFHLLIDASRQRCGYGRAALRLVVQLARSLDGCQRLHLTVHPDNQAALSLYLSEGFTRDGFDDDGELHLSIAV